MWGQAWPITWARSSVGEGVAVLGEDLRHRGVGHAFAVDGGAIEVQHDRCRAARPGRGHARSHVPRSAASGMSKNTRSATRRTWRTWRRCSSSNSWRPDAPKPIPWANRVRTAAVGGQHVHVALAHEVEVVAHPRQEVVAVAQPGRVAVLEHRGVLQRVDGPHGVRRAQRDVPRPVALLEQLHGPLDVGEPTRAELEVPMRVVASRDPLLLDPGLHAAHARRVVVGEVLRVGQRPGQLEEPGPELDVPRHGTGTQQGLVLPGLATTARSRPRRTPASATAALPCPRGAGPRPSRTPTPRP